ncbi:calcineurin B-like protein 8 isoform X1 [Euphorbia lathyris]|uniref:calcineurin B-like protein 8 isoform X1 n=1 Tax=Euphorbia lathyris TaxID=212925 RepID=UPI0033138B14
MGCIFSKRVTRAKRAELEDSVILADQTPFSRNEIEALHELYKKLSTCVVKDEFIQKVASYHQEDLKFALFRYNNKQNLFADRMRSNCMI